VASRSHDPARRSAATRQWIKSTIPPDRNLRECTRRRYAACGMGRRRKCVYLIIVGVMSSAVGGYVAGRLRTKWVGVHSNEVFFRDTAHGFLAWAFATLISATALASIGALNFFDLDLPAPCHPPDGALALTAACFLVLAVLVSRKLCQLRRDLWLARCCNRHDDVDVDFIDRDFVRGAVELRNRASNGVRLHHRT
jgi:hypothetical protein